MTAIGLSSHLPKVISRLQELSILPFLSRQLLRTKLTESFTLEDITALKVDSMILGSTRPRVESGTESATRRITLKILSHPLEPHLQELIPLLLSTKARSTSLEVMEDLASLVSLSTIFTPLICRVRLGKKSSLLIAHQKEEEVTQHLPVKEKFSSMVDGTLRCNSTTSCNSILRRRNGMTLIACMKFTDGTIALT